MIKKRNLFDNYNRYFFLFLRNLKLKKNKNLFNRNLIKNYYFYNFLLKSLKKKKFIFLIRSLFYLNNTKFLINPIFNFKKQLFNLNLTYNNMLNTLELKSFFFSKKKFSSKINIFGLNYYLINNKINKNTFNMLNDEQYKDILKLKFLNINNSENSVNYYVNYNILIFNLLEIYKILILINFLQNSN
jgi:hypothetical protein